MNDRLQQLKRPDRPVEKEDDIESQLNKNPNLSTNAPNPFSQFFVNVEKIKHNIAFIQQSTENIQRLCDQGLRVIASEEEQIRQQANSVISEASSVINETKNIIKALQNETQQLKGSGGISPSEIRVRENMSTTLLKKFVDTVKEYQQVQTRYKIEMKKRLVKNIQLAFPEATEEQTEKILQSDDPNQLIRGAILKGSAATINQIFEHVTDKYQDVKSLEQSVNELHNMFLQFAEATDKQGELIDHIESHVRSASDFIDDGNKDLLKSVEIQKNMRKTQCCIVLIILIVIIIVLAVSGVFNKQ